MPRPPGKTVPGMRGGQKVLVSIGTKELRNYGGVMHLRCDGALHSKGKWLPTEQFPIQKTNRTGTQFFFRKDCKLCYSHYRQKQKRNRKNFNHHGLIPLTEMRPFLHELVKRCEGYRAAARFAGVNHISILRWCGRVENDKRRYMQKESAVKIMNALILLRSGEAEPVIIYRHKRRPSVIQVHKE